MSILRKALKNLGNEQRYTFVGTFVREGIKPAYKGLPLPTILLQDIKLISTDEIITDHLWFNKTKQFSKLSLHTGDIVQFDARVSVYEKGYKGYREDVFCPVSKDYKLSYPTKIKKLGVEIN